MIVRELITRLSFQTDQQSINNVDRNIDRVRSRAEGMAQAFKAAIVAFASIESIKGLVQVGDRMQNIRSRIAQLPQTIGEAGAAFDVVAEHASAAGMAIDAYSGLYTRVGNAAKSYIGTQEDLLKVSDTIAKSLVVGGASAEEASSTMLQFGQALASGVLQGDEFRSMAEAAPQYLEQLSIAMGVPREELKKMASDGKLTAKAVVEATKQMSGYFEDKFNQMPMTVGRAMTVVANNFGIMIDKINRKSMFITKIAGGIIGAMNGIAAGISWVVDKLGGLDRTISLIGIAFSVAIGSWAIPALIALGSTSAAVLAPFLGMVAVIGLLTLAVEDLWVWIQGGESVIGDLIGPWIEWRDTVFGAVAAVKAIFQTLGEYIAAVAAIYIGALSGDTALMREGWLAIVGIIENLFGGLVSRIIQFFVDAWNRVKQLAIDAFNLAAEAVVLAFQFAITTVKDLFMSAFAALSAALYNYIYEPIVNAVTNAWSYVTSLVNTVQNGINSAKSLLGGIMGKQSATPSANTAAPLGPQSVTEMSLSKMAPSNMGAAKPNVNNTTSVTVTVPPGTSQEQSKFIENSAQKSFERHSNAAFARDIAVYAP